MSEPKHYIVKKDPLFCEHCNETLGEHRWDSTIFNKRHVFCTEKCAMKAWANRFNQRELKFKERKLNA